MEWNLNTQDLIGQQSYSKPQFIQLCSKMVILLDYSLINGIHITLMPDSTAFIWLFQVIRKLYRTRRDSVPSLPENEGLVLYFKCLHADLKKQGLKYKFSNL